MIGVGSVVKPGSGVKVRSPVVGSNVHVPSPGTTTIPSPSGSPAKVIVVLPGVAGVPSLSKSFASRFCVAGWPTVPPTMLSSATGGSSR